MDMNTCDCCGTPMPSIDLFWNVHWEEHTERQLKVIHVMNEKQYEAVCINCFYDIVNGV